MKTSAINTELSGAKKSALTMLDAEASAAIMAGFQSVAHPQAPINTSGFVPLDLRVLVHPDPVADKVGSVFIPETAKDREKYATVKATLIAAGENAWEEAGRRSDQFTCPAPGDRIIIAKYGGILLTGNDGREYRIMNDEDVIARLED